MRSNRSPLQDQLGVGLTALGISPGLIAVNEIAGAPNIQLLLRHKRHRRNSCECYDQQGRDQRDTFTLARTVHCGKSIMRRMSGVGYLRRLKPLAAVHFRLLLVPCGELKHPSVLCKTGKLAEQSFEQLFRNL